MRFVWAIAAFFLAAVLIGAGIAQRTVFLGPKTEQASISVTEDLPYTLIDGEVLNRLPGAQTLMIRGEGTIFAAYGRTNDLQAWLADTDHNAVSLDGDEIVSEAVDAVQAEPGDEAAEGEAGAQAPAEGDAAAAPPEGDAAEAGPARTPAGSDLWLDEFEQEDALITPLQLPSEMSVLVASDGIEPAPSDVTLSWPLDTSTPWAGPLIAAGGILMFLGVLLYVLGIRHARRSRGPRRKGLPPLAETQPIDIAVEGSDKGVITAGRPRKALVRGRRAYAVLPMVAVSALLFTGCSPDSWPQMSSSPTPSESATVLVQEGQQAPAVTQAQAERILSRISESVAAADEAMDPALAADRLDGAALAERATNYKLRAAIADHTPPTAIPDKPLEILLPQAFDDWPRTFMSVVADDQDETIPPMIMLLTQEDAWSPYKLTYAASMEASVELPPLAPAAIGAPRVPADSSFVAMPPEDLAVAYADVLNKGEDSEYYDMFDATTDQFRVTVASDRQRRLDAFNQTAASTGSLTFESTPGTFEPVALATLESGAIVAITVNETDTVKPTTPDAVIKLTDNPTVKTLTGVDQSSTGFSTTFGDQLFFYVPGQGSNEKIKLLGYGSNILDAKVIP